MRWRKIEERLFPLQITRKVYLWLVALIIFPTLVFAVLVYINVLDTEKENKSRNLFAVALLLEKKCEGSFNDILAREDALDSPEQDKVKILNTVFQPLVKEVSSQFPNIGLGYYSIELDSVLAIGPSFSTDMLQSIPRSYLYFKSYETGKPEIVFSDMSVGWFGDAIMGITYPIYKNGRIIGHTWANIRMHDLYMAAFIQAGKILLMGLILLGFIILMIWFVLNRIKIELSRFADAAVKEDSQLCESFLPELSQILGRIRKRNSKLRECNKIMWYEMAWRRQIEEDLKRFFEISPDLLAIAGFDGYFRRVSPAFEKALGYSEHEIVLRHYTEYLHPEDCENSLFKDGYIMSFGESVRRFKNRWYCKDGSYKWFSWVAVSVPGDGVIYLIGRDITEEKKTNEEFFRLAAIVESSDDAILATDIKGTINSWNKGAEQLFGYSAGEILGSSISVLTPAEWANESIGILYILKEDNSIKNYETKRLRKNGSLIHVSVTVSPVKNEKGIVCGTSWIVRDITEKKQWEESLRISEERFYTAFHSSPILMQIISLHDKRFIDVNESWLNTTGYTRSEVIGVNFRKLVLLDHKNLRKLVHKIAQKGKVRDKEIIFFTKSGEERIGLFSGDIISIGGENCLLGVIHDITNQRNAQKELARLERLHLVGQMAAGVAHEIRNPMTTVYGMLQLFNRKNELAEYGSYVDIMLKELNRVNSIIIEYLSLAKNKAVDLQPRDINSIITNLLPLLKADAIHYNKTVLTELQFVPELLLNENEIRQLVLNLAKNGLEAMEEGGQLTIRTYCEGDEVILFIKDQGNGIEPGVLEKLGTPFLSTKESGRGLGLAICYSIAERHNASISLETDANGTTFSIRFRIKDMDAARQARVGNHLLCT